MEAVAVAYAQGLLIFLCAAATGVVGLLALVFRRRWLAEVFVVAATVTLVVVAWPGLTRALGLQDERPAVTPTAIESQPAVVIGAVGEASIRLDGEVEFKPEAGRAECQLWADGTGVASVSAPDLGDLHGETLVAEVHVQRDLTVGLLLFVNAGPGARLGPFWNGPGQLVSADPADGRVAFERIGLASESAAADAEWPAELSGEIAWSCRRVASPSPAQP